MDPGNVIKVPPLIRLSQQERDNLAAPHSMGFHGARCDVKIRLPERYRNIYKVLGLPHDKSLQGKALVDTGAIATSIDIDAADSLYLARVGKTIVQTAYHGTTEAHMHPCTMTFCGYPFEFQNAPGAPLKRFGLIAIIGRDVLLHGVLDYSGVEGEWNFAIPNYPPPLNSSS